MKFLFVTVVLAFSIRNAASLERRDQVTFQRGPYLQKFFKNHFIPWSHQSAIHAAHGGAHDLAHTVVPKDRKKKDEEFFTKMVNLTLIEGSKNGPLMEVYGPLVGQFAYDLYRTIDWTHLHHEETYDIMSDEKIPASEKQKWNDRSVKYYLEKFDIPRSIAPLEVTMRRAGVMMRPYFSHFRNYFPKTSKLFFVAHWWHPAIYEAMYLGMKDHSQKDKVKRADELIINMFQSPPERMILSRELMPQYTLMNPMSANIFDNLHMLHGIAYDILTYPGWNEEEKKKEINRVIEAMKYKKGDEKYVRMFSMKRSSIDPTVVEPWMLSVEGAMNDIMMEMLMEMIPMMMPKITEDQKKIVFEQFWKKVRPDMEEGEHEGSLHDALMKVYPDMQMMPQEKMVQMMLKKWEKKNGTH